MEEFLAECVFIRALGGLGFLACFFFAVVSVFPLVDFCDRVVGFRSQRFLLPDDGDPVVYRCFVIALQFVQFSTAMACSPSSETV